MKVKIAPRGFSYRTVFYSILILAFLLPFVFILTAVVTLEGFNNCSSLGCLGRRLGPRFLGRGGDESVRLIRDLHKALEQANPGEVPAGVKLPESFSEFLSDMKNNQYDAKAFALRLKATLFPNLNKVVFLDDDVVIQRDLTPLWDIDLRDKVNGAVETCNGDDGWVMSKRFKTYFNFSHPLIFKKLDPDECAWAFGMNVFDLSAWRKTNIRDTYHYWVKENLRSNLTLWKLGTLPPALIAFRGKMHPIDPSWHMLGLGYQEKSNIDSVKNAAVIHFNGQCKPWLEIGYRHLQPFWTKHVNYSNDFIRNCHILEPE